MDFYTPKIIISFLKSKQNFNFNITLTQKGRNVKVVLKQGKCLELSSEFVIFAVGEQGRRASESVDNKQQKKGAAIATPHVKQSKTNKL